MSQAVVFIIILKIVGLTTWKKAIIISHPWVVPLPNVELNETDITNMEPILFERDFFACGKQRLSEKERIKNVE